MVEKKYLSEHQIEALMSEMALQPQDVSGDLLERVLLDAEVAQNEFLADVAAPVANSAPGFFASLFASIGGLPATASLASVAAVGIWIGFSPPTLIDDLTSDYLVGTGAYDMGDLMPAIDGFLNEG
jgi:hypothetical protein